MPDGVIGTSQRRYESHCGHRFSCRHGGNIRLSENSSVASRVGSFNDALVFTENPLQPNELFLMEIERNDHGWNGSLRVGITHDPYGRAKLPQYSIPGLTTDGSAWVYTLDRTEVDDQLRSSWIVPHCKMHKHLRDFPQGHRINLDHLLPRGIPPKKTAYVNGIRRNSHVDEFQARLGDNLPRLPSDISTGGRMSSETGSEKGMYVPTYEGSRVGMFYTEENASLIFIYVILNGDYRGPFPFEVQENAPLFVVCDVYGYTKTIRILPAYQVPSLKCVCRETIISCAKNLYQLPLPLKIINYLTFESPS